MDAIALHEGRELPDDGGAPMMDRVAKADPAYFLKLSVSRSRTVVGFAGFAGCCVVAACD